jgi:hypothetical protein
MGNAIPPELLLPPPRTIRRRRGPGGTSVASSFFAILLFGTLVLVPVGMLIFSIVESLLLARAKLVDGTITTLYTTHSNRGGTHYHVGYVFVADGGEQRESQGVGSSIYQSLFVGEHVKLRLIHIGGWSTSELDLVYQNYASERWEVWLGAGLFNGVFLLILIMQYRQRELLRNGTPIMSRIARKRITRGKSVSYWIDYEFEPRKGDTVSKSSTVPIAFYNSVNEGDALCIVFDQQNPKRNLIYGAFSYECAGGGNFGL